MSIATLVSKRALHRGDEGDAVKAIQLALRALGHDLVTDGDFGGVTYGAVKDFQIAHGLNGDGEVGPVTATALDIALARATKVSPAAPLPSVKSTVPWLSAMRAISGVKEVAGAADSPIILSWVHEIVEAYPDLKGTVGWYDHDSVPWCGLAVAYCMTKAGYRPPKLALGAINWLNDWEGGVRLSEPALGAVIIKSRVGGGHVTLYEGEDETYYYCRGGNQSDMVNVSAIRKDASIKGFMWPKSAPSPTGGRIYTTFAGAKAGSEA